MSEKPSLAANRCANDTDRDKHYDVLTGRAAGKQPARPAPVYAGAKPQLPERFYFQRLILDPESPAEAAAVCMTSRAMTLLIAVVALAVFGLCALLWHRSGLSNVTSFFVLAGVLLVMAGVTVIAENNYAQFLIAVLCTVAAAELLFTFQALYVRLRRKAA